MCLNKLEIHKMNFVRLGGIVLTLDFNFLWAKGKSIKAGASFSIKWQKKKDYQCDSPS
jgi:hypothetical protein